MLRAGVLHRPERGQVGGWCLQARTRNQGLGREGVSSPDSKSSGAPKIWGTHRYRPLPSSKRFFSSSVSGCGPHTETGRLARSRNPDCGPGSPLPPPPPRIHWPPGAVRVPGAGHRTNWEGVPRDAASRAPPRHPSRHEFRFKELR
ncbi:unnamed protein product [Gulo gulo]|uniref:Uncharacterized protein n=1 Tax=Gulo gulo TaxID=48420 RepID=A0A9X9Q9E0_GULGU|nr:unnamed protein product [Gulo gulo]